MLNVGQRVAFAVTCFVVAFGLLWEIRRERKDGRRTRAQVATVGAAVLLASAGLSLLFPGVAAMVARAITHLS